MQVITDPLTLGITGRLAAVSNMSFPITESLTGMGSHHDLGFCVDGFVKIGDLGKFGLYASPSKSSEGCKASGRLHASMQWLSRTVSRTIISITTLILTTILAINAIITSPKKLSGSLRVHWGLCDIGFPTNCLLQERAQAFACAGSELSMLCQTASIVGTPVVPPLLLTFGVSFLKLKSRKKGALIIKGLLGNLE